MSHPSLSPATPDDVRPPYLGRMFAAAPVPVQVTVALTSPSAYGQAPSVTLIVESPTGVFAIPLAASLAVQVGDMLRSAGMRAQVTATTALVVPQHVLRQLGPNGDPT